MPKYRLTWSEDIEAATEEEARQDARAVDGSDMEVTEIRGDNTDHFDVPFGRHVLVWLKDGTAIKARVTGWFRGKPGYVDAQHIPFDPMEFSLSVTQVDYVETQKPRQLKFGMTLDLEHCAHYSTQRIAPIWVGLSKYVDGHLLVTHMDGQEMTVLVTTNPIKTYNEAAALTGHLPHKEDHPIFNYAAMDPEEAAKQYGETCGMDADTRPSTHLEYKGEMLTLCQSPEGFRAYVRGYECVEDPPAFKTVREALDNPYRPAELQKILDLKKQVDGMLGKEPT